MKNIPNLFTLLNLFFGCIAIVLILQNGIAVLTYTDGTQYIDMPERMGWAALFIGLAGLVDFFDGLVARLFKASSPLGKQLDSLADLVSFGVAPGMILYQLLRLSYSREANGLDVSVGWLLPALIFPCCSAYRLARFNIDDTQAYGFKGMPAPAAGLLIASLPLIRWYSTSGQVQEMILNKWVLYGLIIVVGWLMVSKLPLMALKFKEAGLRNNWPKLALVVLAVLAAVFLKWLAVPVVFIFYIIVSLIAPAREKNKTI